MVSLSPILFSRGISHIANHTVVCFKGVLVVYNSSNKVKACVILNLQELQVMKSAYTKSKWYNVSKAPLPPSQIFFFVAYL